MRPTAPRPASARLVAPWMALNVWRRPSGHAVTIWHRDITLGYSVKRDADGVGAAL
jgi:hypothetical protein